MRLKVGKRIGACFWLLYQPPDDGTPKIEGQQTTSAVVTQLRDLMEIPFPSPLGSVASTRNTVAAGWARTYVGGPEATGRSLVRSFVTIMMVERLIRGSVHPAPRPGRELRLDKRSSSQHHTLPVGSSGVIQTGFKGFQKLRKRQFWLGGFGFHRHL